MSSTKQIKPEVTKPAFNNKNEQVCFATLQFLDTPWSYENYLKVGGYQAWRKILEDKISPEDVVEEIFGEFYDEYAKAEKLIREVGADRYLALAKIGLHELQEELGLTLKSETSETLNGWLLEKFGRIPELNEVIRWGSAEFIVRKVDRQRIETVEIHVKQGPLNL